MMLTVPVSLSIHKVCPDNWELLHQPYRKICHLLADFDEWGQILAINILLRYSRTQFVAPFNEVYYHPSPLTLPLH
jgi:AP-3 complex subunit beta